MPVKVALTGAHGVGKTTLANAVVKQLKAEAMSVDFTPEVPRVICEQMNDTTFFRQGKNTVLKQTLLLFCQTHIEQQKSQQNLDALICDRALLDHWAYTKHFFNEMFETENLLSLYEHFISDYCRSYDLLVYVPIEFPPVDDGTRESDEQFQKSIDIIISQNMSVHGLSHITVRGTVDERCEQIIPRIKSLLEVKNNVEPKR